MFELFCAKVGEYIASRPNYPHALFDELIALGLLNARNRIADLGAGTGIFSRALLERGCEVIAVEPNAAIRGAVLAHEDRASVPRFLGSDPLRTLRYPNEQRLSREGLTSLVLSRSYMPARDTAAGQAAAEDTHRIFAAFSNNDHVIVRYQTIATIGRPVRPA